MECMQESGHYKYICTRLTEIKTMKEGKNGKGGKRWTKEASRREIIV
jgi:hypothetical protein